MDIQEEARLIRATKIPVEPDWRFLCCEGASGEDVSLKAAAEVAFEALKLRGCTWGRFSLDRDRGGVWVEGWRSRPLGDDIEADFRPEVRWPAGEAMP